MISFAVMAVLILHLLRIRDQEPDMGPVGQTILGLMYIPVLMSHFILIRKTQRRFCGFFFILVLAFSGDVAAYYVGRRMGKRKLLPEVSPGKTVEGTIGLVAGSIAGCLLFRQLFFPLLPVTHAVILGTGGKRDGTTRRSLRVGLESGPRG